MAYEKDPNEIGALWVREGAKGEYLTGTINGERVVCFRARKSSDKAPDWRVLKSQPRDDRASAARWENREAPRRASRVDDADDSDSIPF